jgi:hypothetical protein
MKNDPHPCSGTLAALFLLGCLSLVGLGCNNRPATDASGTVPSPSRSPGPAAQPGPSAAASPDAATGSGQEPLFVGWPRPTLALLITGQQSGYIEPCGCTGLTNQKGGLVRRYSSKRQLEEQGWEVVALDVGNQVRRFGRQAEIVRAEADRSILHLLESFGRHLKLDLRLSSGELIAITADEGDSGTPFVCANAAIIDRSLTPRFQVIEAAGKKIGVTAVLGTDELAKIASDEIIKQPPEQALREVWQELDKQGCDLYVLLAHASLQESAELAQQVPHFDVVVTAGGAGEPTYDAEKIAGTSAVMVQVGTKGMHVGVIGIFDDPNRPLRYQRVPLDARFPDAPEMLQLLASYQDQLKVAGLEGLGVKPIPYPTDRQFVGSDACLECHDGDYAIWKKTSHGHALDSLTHPGERSEVPRHFDPECISCHVVGWNPQKYLPYVSGYLSLEQTPHLHHVGCESCHGPGSAHVAAEKGEGNPTQENIDWYREEVRLPLAEAEKKCMECHDYDNSPDFHAVGAFERYWKKVEHGKNVKP